MTETQARERLARLGPNKLKDDGGIKLHLIILRHVFAFMNFVLFAAMAISLVVQQWIDAGVVAFVILLNLVIGIFQEVRAEQAMEALKKMSGSSARVVRDGGTVVTIPAAEVVVGDIVHLVEGDSVPADLRIVAVNGLECDEAILTGESVPVSKRTDVIDRPDTPLGDRKNMAFSGTTVSKGKGQGIVVATGIDTEIGAIAKSLSRAKKQKPKLQKRMDMLGFALVVMAVICIGLVIVAFAIHRPHEVWPKSLQSGVTTAVAIIPEGLVPVLTLTMTYGVQKMAKKNALVRKLTALESLGNVNNICSDKTGTLTLGKMTATDLWIAGELFTITGSGINPKGKFVDSNGVIVNLFGPLLKLAITVASLCNTASVTKKEPDAAVIPITNGSDAKTTKKKKKGKKEDIAAQGKWATSGSPTEVALQVMAMKAKMGRRAMRSEYEHQVAEFPFDSTIKRMSIVFKRSANDTEALMFTKGAPERVLELCTAYISDNDGTELEMTDQFSKQIRRTNEDMASRGLRVLCLAYRKLDLPTENSVKIEDPKDDSEDATGLVRELVEQDLVFVGLVGIRDPPRADVPDAVMSCHKAGIEVHMLTGDHPSTAVAIAKQIGILTDEEAMDPELVMAAPDFDKLSNEELKQRNRLPLVVARCSPETKVKMVKALHDRKRYVAMTGDGVNDSPALKTADVGIAMGINGSEVTKQASDIVLLDDSFSTIVRAIREGRRTFSSIRKFVIHLLSGNVAESLVLVLAILVGLKPPINPTQVLWLNMITGTGKLPCVDRTCLMNDS